jgi:scyllo-inositol 2-dehydrogenase (NADP+)
MPSDSCHPRARLAAILQRTWKTKLKRYPGLFEVVQQRQEAFGYPRSSTSVVIAATPNRLTQIARQCLEAGRDVVVDKPFATTLMEATALVELARKSGRLITVYQNRRYDGDFQGIRQIVTDGALGRIVRFETNYDRFRPDLKPGAWRERVGPGSGILFDIAPHLIDHALVLRSAGGHADVRMERTVAWSMMPST